jgi:hypothetical protein
MTDYSTSFDPINPTPSTSRASGPTGPAEEVSALNDEVVAVDEYLEGDVGIVRSVVAGSNVTVDNTDPKNPIVAATSGGSFPTFTGTTSPEGSQTADVGQSYVDTTNGALYFKIFGAATDIGWAIGGYSTDDTSGAGIIGYAIQGDGALQMICGVLGGFSGNIFLTDIVSANGLENGFQFVAGLVDGDQYITAQLGSTGQFTWMLAADGTTTFPGPIRIGGSATLTGVVSAVTGALSSVTDTNAKAVLTSIIAAMVAAGIATDSTT